MTESPNVTPRPSMSEPLPYEPQRMDSEASVGSSSSSLYAPTSYGTAQALKPVGLINEQNTCFLNSTFQALVATAPLISLITDSSTSSLHRSPSSPLPPPVISSARIPALHPEALEPPCYNLLPVTRAFLNSLHVAWQKKDAGGGTSGSGETSSRRSMSLRSVLREIARKYDQYDDYRQQDAHELLRHLLDSMEMEEKDVIKVLQPSSLSRPTSRRHPKPGAAFSSPSASPQHSPTNSAPVSPTAMSAPLEMAQIQGGQVPPAPKEIPENQRMVPFVDVLFGGSFASVVVCEKCKSVSHTYEGFLDISLSLKAESRVRKRDRLMGLFGRGKPSKQESSAMSDGDLSDHEAPSPENERDRRKSMDQPRDDGPPDVKRSPSIKAFGLKGKPSFSFGKKKNSRPSSSASASTTSETPDKTPSTVTSANTSTTSIPTSPSSLKAVQHSGGPTAAQIAYIQRILASPSVGADQDPLAKLKAAHSGDQAPNPPEATGLEDSLRAFTSVEVLEGENAFACKKCWKIKSGRYTHTHAPLAEEDEEGLDARGRSQPGSPELLAPKALPPPLISVTSDGANSALNGAAAPPSVERSNSLHSTGSGHSASMRAPSPLRHQLSITSTMSDVSSISSVMSPSLSSVQSPTETPLSIMTGVSDTPGTDGLSDSSSDEDEEPPKPTELPIGRPKMPPRKRSTHFVLRRAFKRYLIAKPPEVLVFHFKRFKQTHKNIPFTSFYDLKKVDDFVSFPEILDMAPFLAPNRNDYKAILTSSGMRAPYMDWSAPDHGPDADPCLYRLYAIVVHLGTMIGGHYVAYVLVDPERMFEQAQEVVDGMAKMDLENGQGSIPSPAAPAGGAKVDNRVWCACSDTSIRLASAQEALSSRAYLCFYERVVA